jgi:hypothetical protein
MKLSTAAVIIAAGTSNVFSPNVVLAGKAGKLGKTKAAKAQPYLSYSMSTGPPQDVCPCFNQDDLSVITSDNVDRENSSCGGMPWNLQQETIQPGTVIFVAGEGVLSGNKYCDRSGLPFPLDITIAEYVVCSNLIINRCAQVGYPWPPL